MLDPVIAPLAHVGGGVFEPLQLLPPLAALAAYWVRARTLARQGRPVPTWRMACFGGGIALILARSSSPVAHIGGELVLAHMAQHVLMADLAALLLVLGLTGPLLQPMLATRVAHRLRVLAHPVVAFGLWAVDLYVWHLPGALPGGARLRARARAAARQLRAVRLHDVAGAARPAAAAGVVRQRREAAVHRRRAAHRRACSATSSSGRGASSTPTTGPARRAGT